MGSFILEVDNIIGYKKIKTEKMRIFLHENNTYLAILNNQSVRQNKNKNNNIFPVTKHFFKCNGLVQNHLSGGKK